MRLSLPIPSKYKPLAYTIGGTVVGIALYHLIRSYIPLGPFGYATDPNNKKKTFDITSSKGINDVLKGISSKLPGPQGTIDATRTPTNRKGVERYDITATPTPSHDQDIHPVPSTTHHHSTPNYYDGGGGGGGNPQQYCMQCMMMCGGGGGGGPPMMGGGSMDGGGFKSWNDPIPPSNYGNPAWSANYLQ
jgi:hypothetical protein